MVTDVDVSPQGLDLPEAIRGDGHAILAASNEEEVHGAPILYKNTVSYRAGALRAIADQRT
ncbi:hypothetical protein D3C76_1731680 [compost metagenome]